MSYFTTEELRALPDVDDEGRFSPERLEMAHDWIVEIIERECDTSFTVKTVTDERLSGGRSRGLRLMGPYVREVTAISVDGTAYTSDELDALWLQDDYLYLPNDCRWSGASRGNVLVTYTAGYSVTPPADLKEAALRAARNWVLTSDAWSGKDSRATSISNDFGNIALSVAGPDRPTGLPDVDATIMAWARRVRVPKVS